MQSLKSLRMAKGKSSKETAQALEMSEDTYRRKENNQELFTVGECKKIIGFFRINILEFADIVFEPHPEPHSFHKNVL
jgi:transcriptional regulator with XRE-family HTH domain